MATDMLHCLSCQMTKSIIPLHVCLTNHAMKSTAATMTVLFLVNVFHFLKTISHPLILCMLNN